MITEQNFEQFNTLYLTAKGENKESFMFEGQEVLTAYAKYVVEHFGNVQSQREKVKATTSLEKPESKLSTEQIVQFAKDKAGLVDLRPNNMIRLFSDADYGYYVFRYLDGRLMIGSWIGTPNEPEMPLFFEDEPFLKLACSHGTYLKLQFIES